MTKYADLFTNRQLTALVTFSDLISEVIEQVEKKCNRVIVNANETSNSLDESGKGAKAYADAVGVYLAFENDKSANLWSTICSWMNDRGAFRETFARQAIPMVWDYAEANPFSDSGGNISQFITRCSDVILSLPSIEYMKKCSVNQLDATQISSNKPIVISTDPPYYTIIALRHS